METVNLPPTLLDMEELAKRWQCSIHKIQAMAETGQIRLFIRPVALEILLEGYDERILNAIVKQPLSYQDVYKLFRYKTTKISIERFGCKNIIKTLPKREIDIEFCDLVIPYEAVEAFESFHRNDLPTCETFRPLAPDFSCFIMRGREYRFGELQAKIIKRLYEAHKADNPWVYGKSLLSETGSGSDRIQSVFNHNSDWRNVILSDNKGKYRLNLPLKGRQMSLF
jgi:hypothetical protein